MNWLFFFISFLLLPFVTIGLIRKAKALLQNRVGPPLLQPLFNIAKLMQKDELVSNNASWLFRASTVINIASVVIVAMLLPWLSFKPMVSGDDLFLVVYMLGLVRFVSILAALDTGSPFGAFSSSREATLSLLVEPAIILSLVALAINSHSTSLGQIFAYGPQEGLAAVPVWLLSGAGLFLSSIVELSRMPVDDPTTHLELTMVHEAMIIENSGRNLALAELTYAVRLIVLYGLTVQCFLHGIAATISISNEALGVFSISGILILAVITGVLETLMVKLQWTKCPEFIAYALTMGLFACMAAIFRGILS